MITEDLEPLDIELGDPSVRRRIHHKMNRIAQRKTMNVEVSLIGLIVLIIVLVVIITLAAVIQGRD